MGQIPVMVHVCAKSCHWSDMVELFIVPLCQFSIVLLTMGVLCGDLSSGEIYFTIHSFLHSLSGFWVFCGRFHCSQIVCHLSGF